MRRRSRTHIIEEFAHHINGKQISELKEEEKRIREVTMRLLHSPADCDCAYFDQFAPEERMEVRHSTARPGRLCSTCALAGCLNDSITRDCRLNGKRNS